MQMNQACASLFGVKFDLCFVIPLSYSVLDSYMLMDHYADEAMMSFSQLQLSCIMYSSSQEEEAIYHHKVLSLVTELERKVLLFSTAVILGFVCCKMQFLVTSKNKEIIMDERK